MHITVHIYFIVKNTFSQNFVMKFVMKFVTKIFFLLTTLRYSSIIILTKEIQKGAKKNDNIRKNRGTENKRN